MVSRVTGFVFCLVAVAAASPFLPKDAGAQSRVVAPVLRMAEAVLPDTPLSEAYGAIPVSSETTTSEPPEIIVITVPAEDLARCIETLDQVFLSPVEDATVQSVSLSPDVAGPIVRCEAE